MTALLTQTDPQARGLGVLESVRALAPRIRAEARANEAAGNISRPLMEALQEAGCFRLLVPARFGGEEADLLTTMRVYEEVAAADGSTGWVTMILANTPLVFSHLPEAEFGRIYAESPDVIAGGALSPKPMATAVEGGYRATGVWPLGSGSEHCEWLFVHPVILDDSGSPRLVDGQPESRILVLPKAAVEILDTWHVAGLKGTGSNDLRVDDAFVPEEMTCSLFGPPVVESPIFRIPLFCNAAFIIGAVSLGIARTALDEVAGLASSKRPNLDPQHRVAEDHLVQYELGKADCAVRAAHNLLYREAEQLWARVSAGQELSALERVRVRSAGWYAIDLAREAIDTAYSLGGSTAMYDDSPLQRCVRDIRGATQHYAVNRNTAAALGAVLSGETPPPAALL